MPNFRASALCVPKNLTASEVVMEPILIGLPIGVNRSPDYFFWQGKNMGQTDIGKRLVEARGKISQNELARLSKVAQSTITDIESGEISNPKLGTIKKLCAALEISPEWLTTGGGEMRPTGKRIILTGPEATAVKALSKAVPEWRDYVLYLASIDDHKTQLTLLQAFRPAASNERVAAAYGKPGKK